MEQLLASQVGAARNFGSEKGAVAEALSQPLYLLSPKGFVFGLGNA